MKKLLNISFIKQRFLVSSILLLFFTNSALAQLYTLPDNNFRDKLLASYPSVMTGGKLNIGAAKVFTNDLILTGANISDLTGIEYFTSVYKIDASFNNLTTIPDISNTTQLKYLFLNFNQIKQMPNLSALTNLIQLQLANNYLTSLPALNNLYALNYLFVPNNQLTTLPNISSLVNIQNIIIGNNPFVSLPDFSGNANLLELHVHQTGISEIKGLSALTKLTKLYCWGNSITDLSAISNNTTLNGLYAFNNLLSTLPNLKNKPNLKNVEIANNKLTFEDLLPLSNLGLTDFSYAPQDSIGAYTKNTVRVKHLLSLNISEDASVTSNTYAWYKNSSLLPLTDAPLVIQSAAATDAGDYYVKITNSNLPLLTIAHRIWNVNINPACVDLVSYSVNIPYNDCKIGATVSTNIVLAGGVSPYKYTLIPSSKADSIVNTTGDFTQMGPGDYSYTIRDANNCGIDTTLTIKKPNKCDPVIIPTGDPQMNSYFIEQPGTAKIIDLSGNTIMQLTTPAVWYGYRSDGSLADAGYYVILVNNTKVTNITVIR